MTVKLMPSKQIKDHYGAFQELARKHPIIHTSHGRKTLLTISIEKAMNIPELRSEIEGKKPSSGINILTDAIGSGQHLSKFKSIDDINNSIRNQRDAW